MKYCNHLVTNGCWFCLASSPPGVLCADCGDQLRGLSEYLDKYRGSSTFIITKRMEDTTSD